MSRDKSHDDSSTRSIPKQDFSIKSKSFSDYFKEYFQISTKSIKTNKKSENISVILYSKSEEGTSVISIENEEHAEKSAKHINNSEPLLPIDNISVKERFRKYFLQKIDVENAHNTNVNSEASLVIEPGPEKGTEEYELLKQTKFKLACIDFASGSVAGMVQVYISQPFDTVKVKQQTFPKLYKNMFRCFIQTYRSDGIPHGLYAGTIPALVASIAENSVLFAAYGFCQHVVANSLGIENICQLSALGNAVGGGLAAFFSTFTLCPCELVKCKLQSLKEMKQYVPKDALVATVTPWQLTRLIFKTEGIAGFYRGLTSTFVREVPGFFFFFGGYEATRDFFTEEGQTKNDIGPIHTMYAGAVGGICLWTSTFPADVIKSRIQINNLKRSMTSVGMEIVRKEGFLALYNGLLSCIIRTIPATATLFLVYEYTRKLLLERF